MSDSEKQTSEAPVVNIIRTRNDPAPVSFTSAPKGDKQALPLFQLQPDSVCRWAKPEDPIDTSKLRSRIEPWLTALCQSDHLSLLLGSGLSVAVHMLATEKPPQTMAKVKFDVYSEALDLEAKRTAEAANREEGNIEDQIRTANELLRGLQILGTNDPVPKQAADSLQANLKKVLGDFADSILKTEHGLTSAEEDKREKAFTYLVSFLMSFASRTGTRERLHIFTTNYDRIIEAGAEVAGMHLLDRFVGSLAPIFRASRLDVDMHYNPPGMRGEPRYLEGVARYTKLHGSLDWFDCGKSIRKAAIPFGAPDHKPFFAAHGLAEDDALKLMIYPNSSKDQETAFFPYVDMFRDLAAAICRPNHTLITYGYGFGDDHINRIVKDMLTIPSTHLVIISYDDPMDRIMGLYDQLNRYAQITLLVGDHLGNLTSLVDRYLPKPAIDRTTFRMADILKARWETGKKEGRSDDGSVTADGSETK